MGWALAMPCLYLLHRFAFEGETQLWLPLGLLALRPVNFTRTGSDQTLCVALALADLSVLLNAFLAILAR